MPTEKKPAQGSSKPPASSDKGSTSGKTTHRSEQPTMVSSVGTDIRQLLSVGSGKSFDDMTSDDFKKIAESKGVIPRDVRKMTKAFDSVKKNAAREYLVDTDGFNVREDNLPLSRSGRDIGNKKGLDLGDLVGLGSNVSLLAGFASRELPSYRRERNKESLKELPKPDVSQLSPVVNGKAEVKPTTMTMAQLAKPVGSTASGTRRKGTNPDIPAASVAGSKFSQDLIMNKNGTSAPLPWEEGRKGKSGPPTKISSPAGPEKNESGFDWSNFLLGDIPLVWDAENYKKLATVYNPAQMWDKKAREKARKLGTDSSVDETQGGSAGANMGMFTPVPGGGAGPTLQGLAKRLMNFKRPVSSASQIRKEMNKLIKSNLPKIAKEIRIKELSKQLRKSSPSKPKVTASSEKIESNFLNNLTDDLDMIPIKRNGGKIY